DPMDGIASATMVPRIGIRKLNFLNMVVLLFLKKDFDTTLGFEVSIGDWGKPQCSAISTEINFVSLAERIGSSSAIGDRLTSTIRLRRYQPSCRRHQPFWRWGHLRKILYGQLAAKSVRLYHALIE